MLSTQKPISTPASAASTATADENAMPHELNEQSQQAQQIALLKAGAKIASAKEQDALEPILMDNPNRFVLFPIKYQDVRSSRGVSMANGWA